MQTWRGWMCVGVALLTGAASGWAALTTFTYTGAGANPNLWTDAANWTKSGPSAGTYPTEIANDETLTVIPDGKSPGFTTGVTGLYRLQTGNGTVSFAGGLSSHNASPYGPFMTVGTGGLSVAGDLFTSRGQLTVNGNLTVTGNLQFWQPAMIQNAGSLYIGGNIIFGEQNNTNFGPWVFGTAYNGTFSMASIYSSKTLTWTGTPNFAGGRPNYNFVQGGDGGGTWDVGAYTLLGNNLTIGNWPGGGTRHGRMLVNGGTVDVNTLTVNYNGTGFSKWNYLNAQNATFYIRGSGTAWTNGTEGNVDFSMRSNTTVVLDPAAGSLSISTGSKDRGGDGVQPADWLNNFAFWNITLGTGDIITLTGNATIEGLGTSALYAHYLSGSGTIALNGHNVYLDEYPASTVLFTGSGTVYAIPEPGMLGFLGLAALLCVRRIGRR